MNWKLSSVLRKMWIANSSVLPIEHMPLALFHPLRELQLLLLGAESSQIFHPQWQRTPSVHALQRPLSLEAEAAAQDWVFLDACGQCLLEEVLIPPTPH